MTVRNIAAGSRDSYMFFYDDRGRMIGGSPFRPAAGEGSGALEVLGVRTVALTVPESETVVIDGDDGWLGDFEFDSIQARSYLIEVAVNDMQTDAWLLGTNVENIAGGEWGALDIQNAPERQIGFIHQSRAKKFDGTNKGRKAWQGVLVPLATAKPLGRQAYNSREGAVYRLRVTPALASHNPWGVTLASDNAGTEALVQRPFRSDNPYTLHYFHGNNSLSAIPVDHEPAAAAKAEAWRDQGIPLSISSVGTSPKQITLGSAPSADADVVILYQYARK